LSTKAEAVKKRKGYLERFTAVDLIIIAVFALLLRFVFLYIYKALYVVFPWNQAISPLFWSFCMAAMLAMVPKPGATLLWTIVWLLIDFFLQGEDLVYALGSVPIPIITEVVFWIMKRYGGDRVSSLVGTSVFIAGFTIWNWISLNYVFLIPYSLGLGVIVFVLSVFISSPIGAYLGYLLGMRLKRLLG
jgi:hypothetical protein